MALVLTPWALGCFSSNSAQQARLGHGRAGAGARADGAELVGHVPGQAVGAASGGALIAAAGWGPLHWTAWPGCWRPVALSRRWAGRLAHGTRRQLA
jgi:DHA1 family inner membrane transport protein